METTSEKQRYWGLYCLYQLGVPWQPPDRSGHGHAFAQVNYSGGCPGAFHLQTGQQPVANPCSSPTFPSVSPGILAFLFWSFRTSPGIGMF